MDEHFVITLRVANSTYPLKIRRSQEIVYRRAAEEINFKLGQYTNYFTSEKQTLHSKDYMAMTAIQAVAEKAKHELRAESFEERIQRLTEELDVYLKGK